MNKIFENYTIIKETEWAILIKAFVSELEKEVEFWLPKSKTKKKKKRRGLRNRPRYLGNQNRRIENSTRGGMRICLCR